LSFPTYTPDRRYLVTGTALADRAAVPRILERVVKDDRLDDTQGVYILTRSVEGAPVDSAFAVQVLEFSG